jgi:hypothetical protein
MGRMASLTNMCICKELAATMTDHNVNDGTRTGR